jgi:hypothetical protein
VVVSAISLDLENKVGALAEVTRLLAEAGVHVSGVQLGRGPDKNNVRLAVDDPDAAIAALSKHGFSPRRNDVVSLRVKNTPGAIAHAAEQLAAKGINIEAMFLTAKSSKRVHLVMQVDDVAAAKKALGSASEEE